jgi:iron-sulfur cluster assembly protein
MAVTLTTSAAMHVRDSLAQHGQAIGLRLGVRKTGCSGLAYTLDFAETIGETDQVFESHGVTVVVDAKSLDFIAGTEVDYTRDGINEAFKFRNPKMKSECGCGESFSV